MPTALPGLQITRRPRFRVLSCFFTLSFLRFSSLLFVGSTGTTASLNDEKIERVFFPAVFKVHWGVCGIVIYFLFISEVSKAFRKGSFDAYR